MSDIALSFLGVNRVEQIVGKENRTITKRDVHMKITMLVHPKSWFTETTAAQFLPVLLKYASRQDITLAGKPSASGDICFALHYPALISSDLLRLHRSNVVIHAADLPLGRGRSPIHWQVEAGANSLPLTLFEMGDGADNGPIYFKSTLHLDGTELLPEIRTKVIEAEVDMVDTFLAQWPMKPSPQQGEGTVYPKRGRECQKLVPEKTIAEQFDRMRVSDNDLYPLWFEFRGARYELKIAKF